MDGYPKRQAERAELCGAGTEVPHGSPDGKAVRGIAAETGVHIERTEAHKNGFVQADCGRVAEEAPYSALRILEKLREMGFDGGYSIVKAYVSSRKMDLNEKVAVRFETMPGKQGQMDWGFFEDHLVYEDGKWKKLYCFLMILGYSRMRYIEFVTDMSTNTLIRCHQNAFRYFGGYPEEILYDNMKQVVIKRLLKQEDSTLNRQFEDFAGFYGFKPILCRPYRGQTNSENPVEQGTTGNKEKALKT